MSPMEKSDLPEVARKRANKAASAAAEPVERRGGPFACSRVDLLVEFASKRLVFVIVWS